MVVYFRGVRHSLLLLSGYSVFHQVEEIEFRGLVVRFVLSLMIREISLDITILISQ